MTRSSKYCATHRFYKKVLNEIIDFSKKNDGSFNVPSIKYGDIPCLDNLTDFSRKQLIYEILQTDKNSDNPHFKKVGGMRCLLDQFYVKKLTKVSFNSLCFRSDVYYGAKMRDEDRVTNQKQALLMHEYFIAGRDSIIEELRRL